jgi:hypothetical protein
MNGGAGNTASGAFEKPDRRETLFTLTVARRMVPLVRRIVADVCQNRQRLGLAQPELEVLDRQRHDLRWPERSRRYQLREEVATAEQHLQQALAELEPLGVVLVDADAGRVGFPTIVNGRRAYFSWKPGEETLKFWHFAGETVRRLIPLSWSRTEDISLTGKS